MRTGLKQAFLLTEDEFQALPKRERAFFRPAAGQGTIRDGQLSEALYAFYPYDGAGTVIDDEEDLSRRVRRYYERYLLPFKEQLAARKKIEAWYLPTWPRNWQFAEDAKLVSTYFGGRGSFTIDTEGRHVVVDGHAWLWKNAANNVPENSKSGPSELQLLLAYVAIVNSGPFHNLLQIFSRNLQGGQLRLEPRYLNDVPLPDLRKDIYEEQMLPTLAAFGERILTHGLSNVREELDQFVAQLYGV